MRAIASEKVKMERIALCTLNCVLMASEVIKLNVNWSGVLRRYPRCYRLTPLNLFDAKINHGGPIWESDSNR